MATTTNYGWTTPDNTAYVKDGASAIRTLGSSIDTTLFTGLAGKKSGLILLQTATLSGASAANFTNLFTSTYTNYHIVGMLRASGTVSLNAKFLENTTPVSTGYFGSGWQVGFAGGSSVSGARNNGGDMYLTGLDSRSNGITQIGLDVARNTATSGSLGGLMVDTSQGNASFQGYSNIGMTNFTGITIYPASGTFTGEIKLYAYQA
jgi:hypothetical protein